MRLQSTREDRVFVSQDRLGTNSSTEEKTLKVRLFQRTEESEKKKGGKKKKRRGKSVCSQQGSGISLNLCICSRQGSRIKLSVCCLSAAIFSGMLSCGHCRSWIPPVIWQWMEGKMSTLSVSPSAHYMRLPPPLPRAKA